MLDKPRELIILCGGTGSRLQPVLPDRPKLLAPVGNNVFLDFLLTFFASQGIDRFIFCTGHLGPMIKEYMHRNYPKIQALFIQEETPLGTGGALLHALPYSTEKQVLVTNGDTLHLASIDATMKKHYDKNAACTLQCAHVSDVSRYGAVSWNEEEQVVAFTEKGLNGSGWINAGTYIIDKECLLKNKLPGRFSLENDYLPSLIDNKALWVSPQDGYFLDIGIPADLQRAQIEIPAYVK